MHRHRLAVIGGHRSRNRARRRHRGRGNGNEASSIPLAPAFNAADLYAPAGDDWITNGGGTTNDRYSTLSGINTSNVGKLKLAWKIHLKSGGTRAYSQEATPVVYKGVMYISTGNDDVFALDAATGKQLWVYHSHIPVKTITTVCCGFSNRGVAIGDGKVFIAEIPGQLVALDQRTGGVVWRTWNTRWQEGGDDDARAALLRPQGDRRDLRRRDGRARRRDGIRRVHRRAAVALLHLPRPTATSAAERGPATSGSTAARRSGRRRVSIRTAGSSTSASGIPTRGRAAAPGDNLFTDSFVALDVKQRHAPLVVPDGAPRSLGLRPHEPDGALRRHREAGQMRHGISAPGKTGWLYELDRNSGKPLLGIREKNVPQEKSQNTSPTQPYPVGQAFADQCAHKEDYTNAKTGKVLNAPNGKPYKIACIFTPYNHKQYVVYAPGTEGGSDWQPSSYSPKTHYQYICGYNGNTALAAYPPGQLPKWVAGQSYFGSQFGYGRRQGLRRCRHARPGRAPRRLPEGDGRRRRTRSPGRCACRPRVTVTTRRSPPRAASSSSGTKAPRTRRTAPTTQRPERISGTTRPESKVAFSAPGITYDRRREAVRRGAPGRRRRQQQPAAERPAMETSSRPLRFSRRDLRSRGRARACRGCAAFARSGERRDRFSTSP